MENKPCHCEQCEAAERIGELSIALQADELTLKTVINWQWLPHQKWYLDKFAVAYIQLLEMRYLMSVLAGVRIE